MPNWLTTFSYSIFSQSKLYIDIRKNHKLGLWLKHGYPRSLLLLWTGISPPSKNERPISSNPPSIHLPVQSNNRNRKICEICSKLTTKKAITSFRCLRTRTCFTPFSTVSFADFEHVNIYRACGSNFLEQVFRARTYAYHELNPSQTLREKCPTNTELFLVCNFLYSDWIRRDTAYTQYLSVFIPNTGIYGP